jgi:hypothetical protein
MRRALTAAALLVRQFVRGMRGARGRRLRWAFVTASLVVWVVVLAGPGAAPIQAQFDLAATASHLVVDPTNPRTLYAAVDHAVYKSTDGGATWRPAASGLPSAF